MDDGCWLEAPDCGDKLILRKRVALDKLAPAHGGPVTRRQIVVNDRRKSALVQKLCRMAADETSASGDEDSPPCHLATSKSSPVGLTSWRSK